MQSHLCLTTQFCLPAVKNMTSSIADENWNKRLLKKDKGGNICENKLRETVKEGLNDYRKYMNGK